MLIHFIINKVLSSSNTHPITQKSRYKASTQRNFFYLLDTNLWKTLSQITTMFYNCCQLCWTDLTSYLRPACWCGTDGWLYVCNTSLANVVVSMSSIIVERLSLGLPADKIERYQFSSCRVVALSSIMHAMGWRGGNHPLAATVAIPYVHVASPHVFRSQILLVTIHLVKDRFAESVDINYFLLSVCLLDEIYLFNMCYKWLLLNSCPTLEQLSNENQT